MTMNTDKQHDRRSKAGFTIIEMMVVLFILAILVALVVGVGKYVRDEAARKETASTQALLMAAIQAYHDIRGVYPSEPADDNNTDNRNKNLVLQLRAIEASRSKFDNLPAKARTTDFVVDAYSKTLDYRANMGLGGAPVIISAGPDQDFAKDSDNIRSDRQ